MTERTRHLGARRPKIEVLVPFTIENGALSSPEYDTVEFRAEIGGWFAPLGLDWTWRAVTPGGLAVLMAELQAQARERPLVVVNLCDGFDTDGYPGPSVIDALALATLPFTGGGPRFYRTSSSKLDTKRLFRAAGVATAPWLEIIDAGIDIAAIRATVGFPAILKLSGSSAGGGLDRSSVVADEGEARARHAKLVELGFAPLRIFAERFLAGTEATVFVHDAPWLPAGVDTLPAVEMVYDPRVPERERILFEGHRHVGIDGKPRKKSDPARCVYAAAPHPLQPALRAAAIAAYRAVGGDGYARVDLRYDEATGIVNALEVNANPELSRVAPTIAPALEVAGLSFEALVEDLLAAALERGRIAKANGA